MNTNKESKKDVSGGVGGWGVLLLNSLETDDMTLPRLDVKLTCGNTFIAAYLIEKLMKYFLTRLRRPQRPSAVV